MSMRRATLIVPTRDHNEDLFACLKSISESVDAKVWNVRVIVVDDHSPKAARVSTRSCSREPKRADTCV